MKLLKKLLLIGALTTTLLGVGALTACDDKPDNSVSSSDTTSDSTPDVEPSAYVYRVSVQNATGFGFKNITVNLKKDGEVVASAKTNKSGNANFLEDNITAGVYEIELQNVPAGYALPDTTLSTSDTAGTQSIVVITPTGVIKEELPADNYYELGEVMYDFTVKVSDNTTYTLSEVLKEKDLVLLNFWFSTCGPCKAEFPVMHDATKAYDDEVSVLAISTKDDMQGVKDFKKDYNLDLFNMAPMGSGSLERMFGVTAAPTTFLIDRYGVIVFAETGSMVNLSDYTVRFDQFVGEDYVPTVLADKTGEEGGNGGTEGPTTIPPTVDAPEISALKSSFATESANGFAFRFQEEEGLVKGDDEYDEYNWPWQLGEDNEGKYIYAPNKNVNNSHAILYSTVNVQAGDVLVFDYKVGSEEEDKLYITLDGEIINKYSGNNAKIWNTSYCYVFKDYQAGEHEIAFFFVKDVDTMEYDDVVQMKNLRILSTDDLAESTEQIQIFRQAATQRNDEELLKTDPKTPQFKEYVDVFTSAKDEYLHVGSEDGPVLYANLTNFTQWNDKTSVWILAFQDFIAGDGMNYHAPFEDFAWEATQPTSVYGYTPVTEDLRYLLDQAARHVVGVQGETWKGEYHANEWLETCVYWERYGDTTTELVDPLAGITFSAAITLKEAVEDCDHTGEDCACANPISVPFSMKPRGFKYKFIPEKSGAYHVYGADNKGEGSQKFVDSFAFLVDSDRTTFLGLWDDKPFQMYDEDGSLIRDDHFEFYWYFEANKTYYILLTTSDNMPKDYSVFVEYKAPNEDGTPFAYLTQAALGPHSMNPTSGELYLPDAIDYEYDEVADRYYHVKRDGTRGGMIYFDFGTPTALINNRSFYNICSNALGLDDGSEVPVEDRMLYIPSEETDYSERLLELCYESVDGVPKTNELYGRVPVNKEIFDIINKLTLEKMEGTKDDWLLTCYYYKQIDS